MVYSIKQLPAYRYCWYIDGKYNDNNDNDDDDDVAVFDFNDIDDTLDKAFILLTNNTIIML